LRTHRLEVPLNKSDVALLPNEIII